MMELSRTTHTSHADWLATPPHMVRTIPAYWHVGESKRESVSPYMSQ